MKTNLGSVKQGWWAAGAFLLIACTLMAITLQAEEIQDLPSYALQLYKEQLNDNSSKLQLTSIRFIFDEDFYWRNRKLWRLRSGLEVMFNMSSVKAYKVNRVHVAFEEMFRAKEQYVLYMDKGNESFFSKTIRQTNDTEVFDITSLFNFWKQAAKGGSDNFTFGFNISGSGQRETAHYLKDKWRNRFTKMPKRMATSALYLIVYYDDVDNLKSSMSSQYERRAKIRAPTNQMSLCKVYDFIINFKRLGYLKIIHPKSANIRYCFGRCSDSPGSIHTSLHALFLRQVRQKVLNPRVMPSRLLPCCAPAELIGLIVMTREDDGSIIQRNYRDAVVSSCKCR